MRTRIQKWGNSLAVRIPKPFAEEVNLSENAPVELTVRKGKLVVTLVAEPDLSLAELVSRITPRDLHHETGTGGPVGNEEW